MRSKTNIKPKNVPARKIGLTDDKLSLKLGSVDEEDDSEGEEESEDEEDLNMKEVNQKNKSPPKAPTGERRQSKPKKDRKDQIEVMNIDKEQAFRRPSVAQKKE